MHVIVLVHLLVFLFVVACCWQIAEQDYSFVPVNQSLALARHQIHRSSRKYREQELQDSYYRLSDDVGRLSSKMDRLLLTMDRLAATGAAASNPHGGR